MQVRRVLALGSIAGSLVAGCFDPVPSMPLSPTSVGPESTGDGDPTGSISVSSASGSASSVETTGLTDSSDDGVPMSCNDGALNGDETDVDCGGTCPPCEDGGDCVDPEDCISGVCSGGTCQAATCGDGVVQRGEACDDGEKTAECTAMCTFAECGDGAVSGAEECDDGGESAECNADCTLAECGDGQTNATAGEDCDDEGESAECNLDCTPASCGDLVVNGSAGEDCDEGGASAACDADCTAVSCGDGVSNAAAGEDCDDGGESAACDGDCTLVACGDSTVNASAGEECEGGSPDICAANCVYTGCGPDPVALALTHCQANFPMCDMVDGGIVGYGPSECAGCNCGPATDPWRFYCTETSDDTNFNCSACTVGQILGSHDPCQCGPTSPWLDSFCFL